MGKISTYARLTGDNQKLSFTDVQLVALASTLEHAAHGSRHLYIEHCQNEKKYILEKDNLRFSFDAIHISDLSKTLGKKGLIVKNYENKLKLFVFDFDFRNDLFGRTIQRKPFQKGRRLKKFSEFWVVKFIKETDSFSKHMIKATLEDKQCFFHAEAKIVGIRKKNYAMSALLNKGFRSLIACATLDFTMQNLTLQLGLQLIICDGVNLKKLYS